MSRRFLRSLMVVAILSLSLTLPSQAAPRPNVSSHVNSAVAFASASHVTHVPLNPSAVVDDGKSPHYLYVDDGTTPDSIDAYMVSKRGLTHIGNYSNNAHNYSEAYIGTDKLAVARQDKTHGNCLLLVDSNNFSPPGFIDSFSIKPNGSLSSEVSHIQVAGGGDPSEVHVAGDTAYVDSPGNDFESYGIGSGCVLTYLSQATESGSDTQFALIGSKLLVTPNYSTGTIDIFTLGSGGSITLLNSDPSQLSMPDGVAVEYAETKEGDVDNVFTGLLGSPAEAQGGQLDPNTGSITALTGSPATDSSGNFGIPETFDSIDSLLIQGGFISASLSIYSVNTGKPGTPGSMSLLQHTALPGSDEPMGFAQLRSTLFVDILNGGDVDACSLSKSGASNCTAVARLTASTPLSAGIALL